MPATYDPIATTTLGADTNTIVLSSITSAYTDLVLILAGVNNGSSILRLIINEVTTAQYSWNRIQGTGSAASFLSVLGASDIRMDPDSFYDKGFLAEININGYSDTTMKQQVLFKISNNNNAGGGTVVGAGYWNQNTAINSLRLNNVVTNFAAGTTLTLYGILRA